MGDQMYFLVRDVAIPVEPVGKLKTDGWLPCTWVKYSNQPVSFSKAIATVDISDGDGVLGGFLVTGPQHNVPVQRLSDMWTTDTLQVPGGEVRSDWGPFDVSGAFEFDENNQLHRIGTRIVTMVCPSGGVYKFYVFEKFNLAERTAPGTGAPLVYKNGDPLYVSDRGLITNEKEAPTRTWTLYVLAAHGSDNEGDYLILAPGSIS